MGTGFGGTYVLTMDQTRLDGRPATTGTRPCMGQVWRRQGEAIRIDGSQTTLLLGDAIGLDVLHGRAAKAVRRRFELPHPVAQPSDVSDSCDGIVVSDGQTRHCLVPIEGSRSGQTLLWCPNSLPLADHDYKVISVPDLPVVTRQSDGLAGDVVCFTQGTRIKTRCGHKLVEELAPGDKVQTMDNGCQDVLWIGTRHMTGARLHAIPALRPIRISAHALDNGVPDGDLLVSPMHRMLYQGPKARALFNTDQVLIRAKDMIDDQAIIVDHNVQEVTYYHLLFASHQIIWANGLPTESFHPAHTALSAINPDQRGGLLAHVPDLDQDADGYGLEARRNLDKPEAAILRHGVM